MQVLFSNFLMNFSKIYEIRNYLLKNHLDLPFIFQMLIYTNNFRNKPIK